MPRGPVGIAYLFFSRLALAHYHLGNYDEALHYAERAIAIRRLHFIFVVLIACLGKLGRVDEARAVLSELAASEPADPVRYWQAIHPYINPVNREDLIEGLRIAGVPKLSE